MNFGVEIFKNSDWNTIFVKHLIFNILILV